MQRFFLALHATVPATLIAAVFVHLWAPAGLPSLAQRPVWATWVLIGVWLLLSAAATALHRLALWRISLGVAGALLALAGAVGLVLGSAQAPAMLIALAMVGLAWVGIAAFIGPQRLQAPRRKAARPAAGGTSSRAAGVHAPEHAAAAHTSGDAGAARRRWHPRHWARAIVAAHLPFWLCGGLAVESFRLAHIVATEPARSSGMLGLLLAFFIALPAATLRAWAPRIAELLWVLAVMAYGGLMAKSGLLQWAMAAALCALAACSGPMFRRARRALRYAPWSATFASVPESAAASALSPHSNRPQESA